MTELKLPELNKDLLNEIDDLNAELKQLDSKINGERITYDVKKQQLKANGNGKSRVQTVLIPTQLQQKGKK